MLNKLIIENFQSHEKTEIDFSSGVNVIHGLSQAGKTAIFRALYWLFFNKPSGFHFHSSFAKEPFTRVTAIFNDCKVSLEKTKSGASYTLEKRDGVQHFSVVGNSVPEEIQNAINISDLNISSQLESPFLIVSSPGEIGRLFNTITNSEKADELVSILTTAINKTKASISSLEAEVRSIDKNVSKIEKLEKNDHLFVRYQALLENQGSLEETIKKTKTLYKKILKNQELILQIDVRKLDELFQLLTSLYRNNKNRETLILRTKKLYERLENTQKKKELYEKNLEKANTCLSMFDSLYKEIDDLRKKSAEYDVLIKKLERVVELDREITRQTQELEELKSSYIKMLSANKICPYCFSKIDQNRISKNL